MHRLTVCAAVLLMGCDPGPVQANLTDTLKLSFDEIQIAPSIYGLPSADDHVLTEIDGAGVLLYVDALVQDDLGQPREGIQVEAFHAYPGMGILPESAVRVVDYPALPDGVESRADIIDACTDDDGVFTNAEDWCGWHYDIESNQYLQFSTDFASTSGNYLPNYSLMETGASGSSRLYIFIDYVAIAKGTWVTTEVDVAVSISAMATSTVAIKMDDGS